MKAAWYSKKWVTISMHVAAWLLFFALPYLLRSPDNERPSSRDAHNNDAGLYFSIIMNCSWIVLFYFNAFILIPRFIYKKKYWQFTVAHIVTFATMLLEVFLLITFFLKRENFNARTAFF